MHELEDAQSQELFRQLKSTCVPLMRNTALTPTNASTVTRLLSDLLETLRPIDEAGHTLKPSLVSYIFFPLSTILRRNASSEIPDAVFERLLLALAILCNSWWWEGDVAVWEQILMLAGSVITGIEGRGKTKARDDETKAAAVRCLWALFHGRADDQELPGARRRASDLQDLYKKHAQTSKILPIVGQTLDALLGSAASPHLLLQHTSLDVLSSLIETYLPEYFIPSILPGVVSATTKLALGVPVSKTWAKGDTVARALVVMQHAVVRAMGDDVCAAEGAIRRVDTLEELADLGEPPRSRPEEATAKRPYATPRTPEWLRGTATQLHIALNTLTPLVGHPTPVALRALSTFSSVVLSSTSLTLPQSQPLLLSFLLSLSLSEYESVSGVAQAELRRLLAPSAPGQHTLLQTLVQTTRDSLASLPRLIPAHVDAKIQHAAGLVTATCLLARPSIPVEDESEGASRYAGIPTLSAGIGKFLGPTGGIERWGLALLSVLSFTPPSVNVIPTFVGQLLLESESTGAQTTFPLLELQHVSSRDTQDALVRMLRALGAAAGERGVFAVEWFASVGRASRSATAVAALWCAGRLLEGAGDFTLGEGAGRVSGGATSGRLARCAKGLAKAVAEMWDEPETEYDEKAEAASSGESTDALDVDENRLVEHVSGFVQIKSHLGARDAPTRERPRNKRQPLLHKAVALQLLAATAGVLQARFTPLLLHVTYPILQSIISPSQFLSTTGLAALAYMSVQTSYASPANLLLSNFDYALDAVSRRLTRRWLDLSAPRALVLLVHLVGHDVVQRAGDVVEECFDRLDEYHGYEVLVEGLVEVLLEVVRVIEAEGEELDRELDDDPDLMEPKDTERLDALEKWFKHRHDIPENDDTDYGPAPRSAWSYLPKEDEQPLPEIPFGIEEEKPPPVPAPDPNAPPPPTPSQALTKQIVARSLYFLTHPSPGIRARILHLLASAVPVLPESALLPAIHEAWPFILNRLADSAPFVVGAAAALVEALATHVGPFMYQRVWNDVWPLFRKMLHSLAEADRESALAMRGPQGSVGTESAYTHSHRLYRALMRTMTAVALGVRAQDKSAWEVLVGFRRFLNARANQELQECARELYIAMAGRNEDAVWLVLDATLGRAGSGMDFLVEPKWDIGANVGIVMARLEQKLR